MRGADAGFRDSSVSLNHPFISFPTEGNSFFELNLYFRRTPKPFFELNLYFRTSAKVCFELNLCFRISAKVFFELNLCFRTSAKVCFELNLCFRTSAKVIFQSKAMENPNSSCSGYREVDSPCRLIVINFQIRDSAFEITGLMEREYQCPDVIHRIFSGIEIAFLDIQPFYQPIVHE